jgi:hypothetical protein
LKIDRRTFAPGGAAALGTLWTPRIWSEVAHTASSTLFHGHSRPARTAGRRRSDAIRLSLIRGGADYRTIAAPSDHDRLSAKLGIVWLFDRGGDLEQIKFLLGHSSIQTTERYLGSEQDIEIAVNDNLGL